MSDPFQTFKFWVKNRNISPKSGHLAKLVGGYGDRFNFTMYKLQINFNQLLLFFKQMYIILKKIKKHDSTIDAVSTLIMQVLTTILREYLNLKGLKDDAIILEVL